MQTCASAALRKQHVAHSQLEHGLFTEANAQHGHFPLKVFDDVCGDSRVAGVPRACGSEVGGCGTANLVLLGVFDVGCSWRCPPGEMTTFTGSKAMHSSRVILSLRCTFTEQLRECLV